jgi:hypothetical protein
MTTPDRGLRLRSRRGTRCFLRQHGDVDHHTRVLSVAGATLAPSTLSLIRNMFLDPDQHAFVLDPDGNNIDAVCHGPEQEA